MEGTDWARRIFKLRGGCRTQMVEVCKGRGGVRVLYRRGERVVVGKGGRGIQLN